MKTKKMAAVLAMALAATPVMAQALPPMPEMPRTLRISATAEEQAVPDLVEIGAGVVTQAPDAAAALSANNERMTRAVASLKKAGIAARDIQTSGLNVQPQYKYGDNQPPQLVGFQVTNRVSVVLRKVESAGKVIDTLVREGANQIDGPNFRLANSDPIADKARVAAVKKARERAELYANAAGLKVRRVLSISEGQHSAPITPMPRVMMAREASFDKAPVEAGELSVSATVTMEFELE